MKLLRNFCSKLVEKGMCAAVAVVLFLCASCITNHCNDSVYAPLNLTFYSEIDTAVAVTPSFFCLQGVGSDSIIFASGQNNVNLTLNDQQTSTDFVATITFSGSPVSVYLADSEAVFLPYWKTNVAGKLVLDSIPSTYISLDGTARHYVTHFKSNYFVFDDGSSNILAGQSDGYFYFQSPNTDTLRITHENTLEFVSAECGCMNTHTIKQAVFLHKGVASAQIVNPLINNQNYESHIKLFLENY